MTYRVLMMKAGNTSRQ